MSCYGTGHVPNQYHICSDILVGVLHLLMRINLFDLRSRLGSQYVLRIFKCGFDVLFICWNVDIDLVVPTGLDDSQIRGNSRRTLRTPCIVMNNAKLAFPLGKSV